MTFPLLLAEFFDLDLSFCGLIVGGLCLSCASIGLIIGKVWGERLGYRKGLSILRPERTPRSV